MERTNVTINDAAHMWVESFNAIPYAICEKLLERTPDELLEVTPPAVGDQVYTFGGEHEYQYGEISKTCAGEDGDLYEIEFSDGSSELMDEKDFEVQRDGGLPMWGTLWAFGDSADDYWLDELDGLQKMADCGFRIYEQEDFGHIFGIDGCGYSFYEAHWIPLYKARGLRWHTDEEE